MRTSRRNPRAGSNSRLAYSVAPSYFCRIPPPRRGISPVFSAPTSSHILSKLEKRKSESVKSNTRSVRPLPIKGGLQQVKENVSRRSSSTWSSHYPTGWHLGTLSTHNNRPPPPAISI